MFNWGRRKRSKALQREAEKISIVVSAPMPEQEVQFAEHLVYSVNDDPFSAVSKCYCGTRWYFVVLCGTLWKPRYHGKDLPPLKTIFFLLLFLVCVLTFDAVLLVLKDLTLLLELWSNILFL